MQFKTCSKRLDSLSNKLCPTLICFYIKIYLYLSFVDYCLANVTCPEDQFMCTDGQLCIPIRWKCDSSADCQDGSDEPSDCPVRTCIDGQFQCSTTKQCIPMGWVCDGEPDCGLSDNMMADTSDEDSRRCHRGNACHRNYFRCKDGITCRKIAVLCDGNNDCPDQSDEEHFCANTTSCLESGCAHGCKPTLKGPVCYCEDGKEPNGTQCIDANECYVEGVCDQICINKADSHECQCVEGYIKNGSRCLAINEPPDLMPTIIFANSINVQQLYLNGSLVSVNSSVPVKETLALDFCHRNQTSCWISHNETKAQMECAFVDNLLDKWVIPRTDLFPLSSVNQMAFDWIANNWYFLDDSKEMIFMCNGTLDVCIVVIDVELSKPRAIALDPTKGFLFFTEWGSTAPLLERSRLDGSNRTRLVEHKIVYPYGITIDFPNEHIYWVDTYLDFIERINYNGSGRHTIIRGLPVRNLYGITLFEKYLYVTSWHSNSIIAVNKFNHSDIRTLQSNLTRPFSIHVYHRQRQPSVEHPCALHNGGCDHICITHYTGKTRKPVAMCRCLAGHRLVRGGQCVIAKQSQFLLYARGRPGAIKGVTMGVTGKKEEAMVPITSLSRPTALDFDARSQFIYYSDVQRFVIERQTINGSKREVFLDKGLNNCEGLAIDWMGRNLYWTDEGLLSVFVARLDNSEIKKRLIHGNMSHPRAIVVDPKRGYMYWSDWSTEPRSDSEPQFGGKIERAFMNGNRREVFVSSHLQWPNSLSIDYIEKKLYWCDAYLHRIERIDLDDGRVRQIIFEGEKLGHPYGLVYFNEYLFWTEFQHGIVQRLHIKTKELVELVLENPPLFEIRLFDNSSQNGMNDCTNNNNGCEDLCLATPTQTVCTCRDGYILNANKTFCEVAANYTEPSRCKEGEFECVKNLRCIDVRYLCDGDNDCADGTDEDTSSGAICSQVTCREDHFRCDNNRCISIHWICDGESDCKDGSDEEKCGNATCSASQFTCKVSGRCIPASWTCDSDNDCGPQDYSDEHEKCAYPECEAMEFRCKNQRCVPLEYVCDADDDCRDNSDEINCNLSCNTTTQFTCDSGQKCLHTSFRCNGVFDCVDGTDEENCFSSTFNKTSITAIACHKDEFNCKSGGCIPQSWLCDGKNDCFDRSDEKNCNSTHSCQSNEFRCKSTGHCIPSKRRCDNRTDCEDNSDESECPKDSKFETSINCFAPNRTCIGKQNETLCLEISRFCDNRIDCFNGADEGGLCEEDYCFFSHCKGLCHNIPNGPGYTCYCSDGLTLSADGVTCTDSIPCQHWGTCSQKCVQLKYSHKCECVSGYQLEADGFTCKSTDPATPFVIFSNRHEIRSVDLHTMSVKPLLSGLKNTIALDFYHSPEENMIFWTDVMDDKIYRGFLIHGSLTNIEVIVQIGLATAEGLAVDWIANNIYWVESNLDQIEVAKLNGSFRRTLIAGQMVSPRAIALDCRFGILFWTDWDSDAPRIESASMSGEDRKLVYRVESSDGAWPNGLVLDYVAQRVYWIDARSDSINTVKYDGTAFHEVLRGHELLTHPFAISLYGNHVYWTDWRTNSVIRANKWNGTDIKVVQRAITQPFDIKIFHPSRQPINNITSLCNTNNGGCSHLCLINKNNTYRCKCPHIMKLDIDNKTCLPNERVLLISRPNEIRGVDLEQPYYHTIPPINLPKVISAAQLDYIAKEKQIYWADSQLNEVKRTLLTGSPVETIIDTVIEHPYGFALDWVSRNIFVTSQESTNKAKIFVCNINGEFTSEIIRDQIYNPRSLVVHPFNGLIIWADHGIDETDETNANNKDAVIAQAAMDGTSIKPLVRKSENKYLDQPSSLAIDFQSKPNRLYWVNIGSATIQFIDLETNKINTIWDAGKNTQTPLEPLALSVYNDFVLFSSQADNSIHLIDKTDGSNHSIFRNNTEDVITIKVYDSSLQSGTNLCESNNGNCSHLCLMVSQSKTVCKCAIGFQIDPKNDTNCLGPEVFLMYSWNWGIRATSGEPNATLDPMLPPISRVLMASVIDYIYKDGFIYWVDNDDGSITRIKRDTTHHQIIVHGVEKIEGFAVDWMANNVYWVDPDYDVIEVSHLNGSCRYVILSGNMDKPNSLAVHPLQGYIFWSDIGLTPRIERALLDGSERVVISNSSINMINDLAVDVLQDKIYWCDSQLDTIERMNLDGTDREIIISGGAIESPISITIFKQYIYWADTNYMGGAILRADKDNVNITVEIIQSQMGDHIKDIKVFHKRPTSMNNKCAIDNGGCQELCLFRGPANGHRCACAHGRVSALDNKTCEPYDAFIMYSRVTEIDSIHMNEEQTLNAPYPSVTNKDNMRNVIGLTFDYSSQRVIYSDIQRGSISSSFFNGTGHKLLVEKQGSVEGIVYDPMYGELYWTSNSDASISRLNLRLNASKIEKIIKLGLEDKPRGIAVDSCASRVYWTNWNNRNPSIQRAYLSGYDLHAIITSDIRMPNAITIDHKLQKLYWSDARLDKIEKCNLDGTERHLLLTETPKHPFDLAVTVNGNYLFWTDWVEHAVYRCNKFTGSEVVKLRKNIPRPMGIIAVSEDIEDCTLNPCLPLNGGCEDGCNVASNGTIICSCFIGRTLSSDGKTCVIKNSNCSNTDYECGTGVCIPFELTCDGVSACPDDSDENLNYCAMRECPKGFFRCSNNRCILQEKHCDGQIHCADGSDERDCICGNDKFKCKDNGQCIGKQFQCDSDPDCSDGSDEIGCERPDCSKHPLFWDPEQKFINCPSTTACIHPDWLCDGQNDCWDHSDEVNCKTKTLETSCPPNSFKCLTAQCIPMAWVCDRDNDCDDRNLTISSDEENCDYGCQADQFKCNNSDCIPNIWRCDGHQDCSDGSDETEDCRTRICPNDWFRCNNTGQCIPAIWVCDGENDCGDQQASDEHPEQGCNASICKQNEFQCLNFQCILQSFYCDGDDDCGDKSDEPENCSFAKCQKDQFECRNKKCIPKTWLCNEIADCHEGEDEENGLCIHNMTTSKCNDGKYECENEICVEADLLCDGNDDCGDYSDESKCNVNECESGIVCAQRCEDMPIGYKCSCFEGFEPLDGGRVCKDVDECRTKRPCGQHCRNTYGSYACTCEKGYYSIDGGITCKANSSIPSTIIFSNRYYIRQINIKGHDNKLLVRNLTNAVALDFDWAESCIYWSDVTALGSSIKRLCETNSNQSSSEQILHSATLQSPDGIAVDWIARNLYWCDKGKDTIEVSKLDGKFRKVLIRDGLEEPRAIVLNPYEGYLYWTDWGENPYIGKAGMDGSHFNIIINESLGWPNALTIDYINKELFYADAREDYIAVTDLFGKNRHVVVSRKTSNLVHHIFALSVFEDTLYWSDWETKGIEYCHKYHCSNVSTLTTTAHRPMDLHIYHPYRQLPLQTPNPCESGQCSTLCLLKPNGGSVCACPENYLLQNDSISCVNNCTTSQFVCHTTFNCIPFWWKCDTQDDCGDGSDEPPSCPEFHCSPGQFQCQNTHCIPPSQLCDGISQCGDNSDERDCDKYTCLPSQYKCAANGTVGAHCISATSRCDGLIDCPGKEDELNCPEKNCMNNQFKCLNNRCIPQVWQCDGDDDCGDGSDEPNSCTSRVCSANYFKCETGRCIPLSWKCDGDFDCVGREDEPSSCKDKSSTCNSTYFKCNNNKCIPSRWHCDFEDDCGDNSDEINCKPRDCSEDEFRCTNGRCIRSLWRCNGEYNCEDKSDEINCNVTCNPKEFHCHDSNFCILNDWKCDGDADCPDSSDEQNCGHTCMSSEFLCDNGQCVSALWRCDGEDDCGDNSDEELSRCSTIACPPGRFRCKNNICIPNDKVCDGKDSCGDQSDEESTFCSHYKHCSAHQFQCLNKHCIDSDNVCNGNDDCTDNSDEENCDLSVCHFGTCSQLCLTKKLGNHSCTCAYGYSKSYYDNTSCTALGEPAVLLVASENGLRKVNPYKTSVQELIDILSNVSKASRIDSFDVMYETDKVTLFWTSFHTRSVYRFDAPMIEEKRTKRDILQSSSQPTTIASGLIASRGIAVDWISKNLYWIDAGSGTITISTTDGSVQRTLISDDLDQPHDIVVDPKSGFIFWTDWGRKAKIERSRLDGSMRKTIVERNLQWPTGLAIDYAANRIYWTDPKAATIETIDIEGKYRHIVKTFNKSEEKPYKIEVFEDHVYVSTFHNNAIFRMNKFGGGNITYLVRGLNKASDVVIVQENKQNHFIDNPCLTKHCGEGALCVAQTPSKAICLCSNDMIETPVGEDGGSVVCTPTNSPTANKCDLDCLNGGTCYYESDDSPKCRCPPGFDGPLCDRYRCSGYCKNKGHCYPDLLTNNNNRNHPPLRCECPPQWIGERCETPVNICDNFCLNDGICRVEYGVPQCRCLSDFFGQKCQNCYSLKCENSGHCRKNEDLTYACHCPPGYSGDRCQESLCDNYCSRGNCTIIAGVPQCTCFAGYSGKKCDQDVCKETCLNGGTCQRNAKKTICVCPVGYQGKRCEQNLCGCRNGGTCILTKSEQGHNTCLCRPHFMGAFCERFIAKSCDEVTCLNGGYCELNLEREPYCKCANGWSGPLCEIETSPICNSFCLNGGTCSIAEGREMHPICSCSKGWVGSRCETFINCKGFCFNGATCVPIDNSDQVPSCLCAKYFEGLRCEIMRTTELESEPEPDSLDNTTKWILVAVIPLAIILILSLAIFIGIFAFRIRRSNRAFMHRRMEENGANVEISNPMFGGEDFDDEPSPSDALSRSFSIEVNEKSTNFTNPMYEYQQNSEEEKRTLLISDNEINVNEDLNEILYKGHPLA